MDVNDPCHIYRTLYITHATPKDLMRLLNGNRSRYGHPPGTPAVDLLIAKSEEQLPKPFEMLCYRSNGICNLPKHFFLSLQTLYWSPFFEKTLVNPLRRSTKVVISPKKCVPKLKALSPNAHTPWEGVAPPPRPNLPIIGH